MIIPAACARLGDISLLTRFFPALFALLILAPARAENWPMWRGPRLDGVAAENRSFPVKWSDTDNIAWKTPIPGRGHSSPIVWGDRIYLTTCIEVTGERLLLCIDRHDGRIAWKKVV